MAILVYEASLSTRLSCILFDRGPPITSKNRNLRAGRLGFHYFFAFGTPDETLKFVFELLHETCLGYHSPLYLSRKLLALCRQTLIKSIIYDLNNLHIDLNNLPQKII